MIRRFRFLEHRPGCLVLAVATWLSGQPAHGGAYLPVVGPPPLRFEVVAREVEKVVRTLPVLPPSLAVVRTNPPPGSSAAPNNPVAKSPPAIAPPRPPVPSLPEDFSTNNLSTNSAGPSKSADNLLFVSPQMLVDYFKSNNDPTNSSPARLPAPVDFTPPFANSINSSQATYMSP